MALPLLQPGEGCEIVKAQGQACKYCMGMGLCWFSPKKGCCLMDVQGQLQLEIEYMMPCFNKQNLPDNSAVAIASTGLRLAKDRFCEYAGRP